MRKKHPHLCCLTLKVKKRIHYCVPVAQLDRAFACGAKGRRFKSCRAYQNKQDPEGLFYFGISPIGAKP